MSPLASKKEIKRLDGQIAALSQFLSFLSDWFKVFFNMLRGNKKFKWTYEC